MIPFFLGPVLTTKKAFVVLYGSVFAGLIALTFTAEGATALAVAITALVAAVFTGIVNLVTVLQAKTKIEETGKKTDALLEKTVEIHTATNGTLHAMTSSLKVANEKIDGLEHLIASMAAAAKAQTIAVTEAGNLTPPSAKRGKRGSLR